MSRFLLIYFVLIFFSSGCRSDKSQSTTQNKDNAVENDVSYITYLALGDSYTIGEGVASEQKYPELLKDSLKEHQIIVTGIQVIAKTGWTTDELSLAMDETKMLDKYDLVTLLIGVNNQYRGRSAEEYKKEFSQLLNRAIALAGGDNTRVIVLSIPDWGVTPFASDRDRQAIASEIDAYNEIARNESLSAGVAWLDVTAISRQAAQRPELLAADSLHPSSLMYSLWVQELLPLAVKSVNK